MGNKKIGVKTPDFLLHGRAHTNDANAMRNVGASLLARKKRSKQ